MAEKVVSIKISDLKPGMRIGRTIINSKDGSVLIRKGEAIAETNINKIRDVLEGKGGSKIAAVDREEALFKINGEVHYLPPKTSKYLKNMAINPKVQQEAISAMENVVNSARMGTAISVEGTEKAVSDVLDNILDNGDAALNLMNIKNFDDYTYTHSVNVSTISLLIGSKLGLERQEILQLGVGAILHDLGKIKVPLEILNKASKLDDDEFEIMKNHPVYTYEILKNNKDITEIEKFIASQHHEKYDGKGYPNGLAGKNINYFARIVAIADVYDALTTDRIYRKAMSPYEATRIIVSGSGTHFDSDIVRVFLKTVSIYPIGSYVKLNTGETAVIKKVESGNLIKPDVIVVKDKFDKNLPEPVDIRLINDSERYITGPAVLDE